MIRLFGGALWQWHWSYQALVDTRSALSMRRLELMGTDTAQVTVATLRIVEAVDVVRYDEKSRLPISIDAFRDSLFLQAAEERLCYGVVPTVAASTHARYRAFQTTSELTAELRE